MRRAWAIAVLALSLVLAAVFALAPAPLRQWQDRIFDRMMLALPHPTAPDARPLVVIDIGARDDLGRAWDRMSSARLAAAIAARGPRAVGFDLLFAGDCDGQGAAMLARGLEGLPVTLGFLLQDRPGLSLPAPQGFAAAPDATLWPATGADGPCAVLPGARGAMVLAGEADALVRRVPVGVRVDGVAHPSLAVAIAARASGVAALAGGTGLRLGDRTLPAPGGMMRFTPTDVARHAARTVMASDVLTGRAPLPDKAVVLVGSSLPERGGLRPAAAGPLTPSVQILADAVTGMLAGRLPARPVWAILAEAAFLLLAGAAGLLAMARLRPVVAVLAMAGLALAWAGAALAAWRQAAVLLDPVTPGAAMVLALAVALMGRAAQASRAERALRARLGQVLPPDLVARIAADPGMLRLGGETREVTAMFTDIEGFSQATARMGPREMVALLDAYFTLTCAIVLRHGGMVDKLVGDSVHALFNAPVDQPDHERAALACAAEIIAATEAFRAAHDGFGRTRIGLECGPAVLGDVGFGGRIDYTAHGAAVNLAARLQDLNKDLGTQVCVGPVLAARVGDLPPLGRVEVRSFGPVDLFTLHGLRPTRPKASAMRGAPHRAT